MDDLASAAEQDPENFSESVSPVVEEEGADLEDVVGDKSEPGGINPSSDSNVSQPRGGVYKLIDRTSGEVMRIGRRDDFERCKGEHWRIYDSTKLRFDTIYGTDNYAEQRALEQVALYTYSPSWDKINPISPNNPNIITYKAAADTFLKKLLGQ